MNLLYHTDLSPALLPWAPLCQPHKVSDVTETCTIPHNWQIPIHSSRFSSSVIVSFLTLTSELQNRVSNSLLWALAEIFIYPFLLMGHKILYFNIMSTKLWHSWRHREECILCLVFSQFLIPWLVHTKCSIYFLNEWMNEWVREWIMKPAFGTTIEFVLQSALLKYFVPLSNYLLVEHLVEIYKYVGQQLKVIRATNLLQLKGGPHSIEFKRCIDYTPVQHKRDYEHCNNHESVSYFH